MKGKINQGYLCLGLIFVVFSVIAFAAPFIRTEVFWIGYAFAVAAIALQIYVFHIAFVKDSDARSRFYGFPIAKIGMIYLLVQLAASLIEMLTAVSLPTGAALIVNVILLAAALVGLIAGNTMKEEITRQDTQLKKNVTNMRTLQSLSASLAGQCSDAEMKAVVQHMADQFRFSDPISSEHTVELEEEMQVQMDRIQNAVLDGDSEAVKELCGKALVTLQERNRVCRLNK